MLYFVFSDSHGYSGNMLAVLQQKLSDELIFLGDGELDLLDVRKKYPDLVIHQVRGNCDVASTARLQMIIKCGRKKIFLCHGHTMGVKRFAGYPCRECFCCGSERSPVWAYTRAVYRVCHGDGHNESGRHWRMPGPDIWRFFYWWISSRHENSPCKFIAKIIDIATVFDRIEALGVRCVKNGPKTGECVKNPYRIKWWFLHQMGVSFTDFIWVGIWGRFFSSRFLLSILYLRIVFFIEET